MRTPEPIWIYQDKEYRFPMVAMVAVGISVLPINPKTKKPLVQWKAFQSEPPTRRDAFQWLHQFGKNCAIGLVTGPINGWVVVDVDDEKDLEWAETTFPPTPVKQRTARGVHYFYRQGKRTIPTKTRIGGRNVDIRGSGGLVIIAPSVVQGHQRRFEICGEVDPKDVPTLDDLENFDELMHVASVKRSTGDGGTFQAVRDEETGLYIDGREGVLTRLIFALCHQIASATGQLPDSHQLARAAWDRFELEADLSDGKWQFEHALNKAESTLRRINEGVIPFELPALAPGFEEPFNFVSADDGIKQLKAALEDFLEYRAKDAHPDEVRHLLIRSPAGLGKTTNTIALAVPYILEQQRRDPLAITAAMVAEESPSPDFEARMLLYVRTHNLATEITNVIKDEYKKHDQNIEVPIWRGRGHDAENGNAPCLLWEQAKLLQSRGYSVTRNLCQRRNAETDELINCVHFERCGYIAKRKRCSDFTILMSAELPYPGPIGLKLEPDPEDPPPPGWFGFFRPTIDGRTFLIDETPIEYLTDYDLKRALPIAVLDQLPDPGLGKNIRDGLNSPEGLLTHLRAAGVTPKQLRRCSRRSGDAENENRIIVTPGEPSVADIEGRVGGKTLHYVSIVLSRLADELSSEREGESYSLRKISAGKLRAQGRHKFLLARMPGIVMDATADLLVLRQFMPNLEVAADIRVERKAFITQLLDQTFSRHTLRAEAQEKRNEVRHFIAATAERVFEMTNDLRTLVVTYKKLRLAWTGEDEDTKAPYAPMLNAPTVDVAHFGALRGLDQFKDHHAVFIVGRQEPRPADIEEQARAIWYDAPEPIQTVPSGGQFPLQEASVFVRGLGPRSVGQVSFHPDERVNALLSQTREAESLQAIDRLRLMHNKDQKEVFLLCKIPLPELVVDRLLSWDDLRAGGTKLERLLKACDERGLNAVPLTPQWLYANFSDFWANEKAAKKWLEAKPQSANRDYRYWGALHRFRLASRGGHPQWAIIKNGTDNPQGVLSAAVGQEIAELELS